MKATAPPNPAELRVKSDPEMVAVALLISMAPPCRVALLFKKSDKTTLSDDVTEDGLVTARAPPDSAQLYRKVQSINEVVTDAPRVTLTAPPEPAAVLLSKCEACTVAIDCSVNAQAPPESAEFRVRSDLEIVALEVLLMSMAPPSSSAVLFVKLQKETVSDDASGGCGYCTNSEAHNAPPDTAAVQSSKKEAEILASAPARAIAPPFP
mmetsp:Transcript_34386/g.50337  ORF Transcript_34386/g.50337 Transcript_34386/m.50337 type:complete len:209 (+) Transcript_34386:824-1450(+)